MFTYAWPTLLSKIQTREIVSDCNTRLGRAVLTLTPDEHKVLRASADERGDLAVHILLDAIDPYLLKLHDGTWQPGRASLPTYFVGACIDERSRGLKSSPNLLTRRPWVRLWLSSAQMMRLDSL